MQYDIEAMINELKRLMEENLHNGPEMVKNNVIHIPENVQFAVRKSDGTFHVPAAPDVTTLLTLLTLIRFINLAILSGKLKPDAKWLKLSVGLVDRLRDAILLPMGIDSPSAALAAAFGEEDVH